MKKQNRIIKPAKALSGTISIPGDKSVSHRSIMLSGLANTSVTINNFLHAQDCLSTVACMKAMGVNVEIVAGSQQLKVTGNGLFGLQEPTDILDAGNSGTTLRLLSGILAAQPFFSVMTGDASLRKRPMGRVITPLSQMGARIAGRESARYAPLAIMPPNGSLQGIDYIMPVASAQIKSAIMLAALFANSPSRITEPYPSRDHSECMLESFGVPVARSGNTVIVNPVKELNAPTVLDVPGDISSAAFWLVAATIIPGSEITLTGVGINPTRTGILDVLAEMGADIAVKNQRWSGKEPIADITVRSSDLKGVTLDVEIIPRLIDEIPVLAVAALFARGKTVIRGAEELRVKETDRLAAVAAELGKLGAQLEETPDGLVIEGPQKLNFAQCHSHDDHRMAMAAAVAGLASQGVEIIEPDCVAISYPDFYTVLEALRMHSR
ncbi:MAG TPA: 3-phosphoshikimate 1-carboxyvinyltransferase [Patescibacteria group bacterium]|nr:3-phosphoshikimate 1-carboxyvinyltransferase [Patescibacteria group bacterium]